MELFKTHKVKPLLGIVPDNKDHKLDIQAPHPGFWDIMRGLGKENLVEYAQHGYQHLYETNSSGLFGKYGIKAQSEFAGLSYEKQYSKLKLGLDILQRERVNTRVWMAPSHSFDKITIKALRDLGFLAITDGFGLYPTTIENLVFVPQQVWRPRVFPFGFITICLHPNTLDVCQITEISDFLKMGLSNISFSEAINYRMKITDIPVNSLFKIIYRGARTLKKYI
ncbi:hypothetical protein SRRS_40250 [Sporomusa rhizae]